MKKALAHEGLTGKHSLEGQTSPPVYAVFVTRVTIGR